MRVSFLLAAYFPLAIGTGWTTCRDGWLPFQGSCYFFGHSALSFTEAEQYCRQHNSHLIHVNDATENAFIRDRLRRFKPKYWWLGITDEDVYGIWEWFDTDTAADYLDWAPGEPQLKSEECAVFHSSVDFQWADVDCTTHICYPLCEMPGTDHGNSEHVITG